MEVKKDNIQSAYLATGAIILNLQTAMMELSLAGGHCLAEIGEVTTADERTDALENGQSVP